MEKIYTQSFEINPGMVDCFGRARPSTLLYLAQEAAGGHCRELALDWDTLAARGLFWAVIRYRVQVKRLPRLGETVTVETWPMPTTRTAFPRATVVRDAKGEELFHTLGLWVLMDTENRTMVLPGKSGVDLVGLSRGDELAPPTSLAPVTGENSQSRRVGYTDLDRNGHMNNTRYMNWVDDLLPAEFHRDHPVAEFTLCYLSEAREGENLRLNWALTDGSVLQVDGVREMTEETGKSARVFSAKVAF
jgi:medium-chain acyl-[acyl-carrier-protein] hydrolase